MKPPSPLPVASPPTTSNTTTLPLGHRYSLSTYKLSLKTLRPTHSTPSSSTLGTAGSLLLSTSTITLGPTASSETTCTKVPDLKSEQAPQVFGEMSQRNLGTISVL